MKKTILLLAAAFSCFAAPLFGQSAVEIFKEAFDNGMDIEIDGVGYITSYAFYDVDGDGIVECFLKGEDGCYAAYCCGDYNGRPSKESLTLALSNIYTTSLSIAKGMGFINNQGGCGTGCYHNQFVKIEKSHATHLYTCTSIYGPDEEEDNECYDWRIGSEEADELSKESFDKAVPKKYKPLTMDDLKWIACKPTPRSTASETTLQAQRGDTVIVKDDKGYFYQFITSKEVGVAAGGAYTGDVVIPAAIRYEDKVYFVTTVRKGAMWKKPDATNIGTITSVTLPETVTLVGADAFRDNPSLQTVNYGKDTRIEVRSFWGCPNLQLEDYPVIYSYTEPYYSENPDIIDKTMYTRMYRPMAEPDDTVAEYQWAIFKSNHNGVKFVDWMNMDSEVAIDCFCFTMDAVKAGVFQFRDFGCIGTMFKGHLDRFQLVLLAHNNYVATHEFKLYSRHQWGEEIRPAPKAFVQSMEKKYGRKIKYSNEAAHTLYSSTSEQLIITEFKITNHEAMVVFSWVVDGQEVCSFVNRQETDPEYEEYSVWNVDDEGDYGIPEVISITKDEQGRVEFFLNHSAPESFNLIHLVQRGNELIEAEDGEQWYNWVDPPINY